MHFAACSIKIYGQIVNNQEHIEPRAYFTPFNNLKALQDNKQKAASVTSTADLQACSSTEVFLTYSNLPITCLLFNSSNPLLQLYHN